MTRIGWIGREPPLAPVGVLATGPAVAHLAAAVLARLELGADLVVARSADHLVVLGEPVDLPWCDGVTWLGRDGSLLLPTTRTVTPDVHLVTRAVVGGLGGHPGLVVLAPGVVVAGPAPVGPPDREVLAQLAGPRPTTVSR